jgi:membrane protease YdiL (CAAX protease family)
MSISKQLIVFFILACFFSWLIQIPLALSTQGVVSWKLPSSLHLLSAYGPLLAAFIVTGFSSGWYGVSELASRMVRWRVGWRWVVFAVFGPLAFFLLAVLIQRVVSSSWEAVYAFGKVEELRGLSWFAGWLVWIVTFGFGEETGWRGFALPRLQTGHSAMHATLILWVFWALWHAPQFFYNFDMNILGALGFLVGMLAGAVLLTGLYNGTGGSVLMVALWHGTYNATVAGVDGQVPVIVTTCIAFVAVSFWQNFGAENLSPLHKQTLQVD